MAKCFIPYPHARILSIDTDEAATLPGVEAVLTAADVPGLHTLAPSSLISRFWPKKWCATWVMPSPL